MTDPAPLVTELLPCPFCASCEAFTKHWEDGNGGSWWLARCSSCGSQTQNTCESELHAISNWNRRAHSTRPAGVIPEGWRPIATAHKKLGEFVDLWVVYRLIVNGEAHIEKAERYALARWVDWITGVGRWIDAGGNAIERSATGVDGDDTITDERRVTHWQPLPEPPVAAPTYSPQPEGEEK